MSEITYSTYLDESQILRIKELMDIDLSEPYTVFTYRYFLNGWPKHCILAHKGDTIIGAIVSKTEEHRDRQRGYIGMLAVDKSCRKMGIGSALIKKGIQQMIDDGCDEIILETETHNAAALRLYENLGFVRDKALPKYYLSGGDAYRLKLWLK